MNIRFYLDPETDLPHIYDHGVTEEEVDQVLRAPGEKMKGKGNTWIALGQSVSGRYLQVVFTEETPDDILVITAYDLRGRPLKAFRRRRRKRR